MKINTDTVLDLSKAIDLAIVEFMRKRDKKPIGGAEIILAFDMSLGSLKQAMRAIDDQASKLPS